MWFFTKCFNTRKKNTLLETKNNSNNVSYNLKEYNELVDISQKYNKLQESFKCVVCVNNWINYIQTCGHLGFCTECYKNKKNKFTKKCVLCKQSCTYMKIILPFTIEDHSLHNSDKPINISERYINYQLKLIEENKVIINSLEQEIDLIKNNKTIIKNKLTSIIEKLEIEKKKNIKIHKKIVNNIKKDKEEIKILKTNIRNLNKNNELLKKENAILVIKKYITRHNI